MPGFMPGIHVLLTENEDVDGRDKPGHDRIKAPAMYDIKWIREHPDAFDAGLRGAASSLRLSTAS